MLSFNPFPIEKKKAQLAASIKGRNEVPLYMEIQDKVRMKEYVHSETVSTVRNKELGS